MGLVYLAEDTLLHQPLCIKVLHPSMAVHPEAIERFHREIVLSRRISHKGVCRLYDLHKEGETRFITMEHAEGRSLHEVLRNSVQLPIPQVITIGRSICEALGAAHDVGVVHRDLKPGNIIMRDDHEVTLLDFGIATALDLASSLTLPGIALGTRSYIAPEVWSGRPATPRSDQFAVGVILYKCLTGELPFPQKDAFLLDAMLANKPIDPHSLRPDVPKPTAAVVLRALSIDPAHRFEDARALGQALVRSVAGPETSANAEITTKVNVPAPPPEPIAFDKPPSSPWSDEQGTSPGEATRPHPTSPSQDHPPVRDITSESGSWLVDGRPMGAPLIANHLSAPTIETAAPETALAPRRSPVLPLLAAFVLAGVVAAALVVAGRAPDDVAELLPAMPAPVPVPPPAVPPAAPVPVAPPAPVAAPVAAVPPLTPAPMPAPPTPIAEGRTGEQATPTASEPRPRIGASARRQGSEDASAYAAALAGLNSEMAERGLRIGDDAELDRLRTGAADSARGKQFPRGTTALSNARARVKTIVVDRAFVERKLRRFNDAFDRVTDAATRARVDDDAGRALTEMAAGRYPSASRALNEGYLHMNEARK